MIQRTMRQKFELDQKFNLQLDQNAPLPMQVFVDRRPPSLTMTAHSKHMTTVFFTAGRMFSSVAECCAQKPKPLLPNSPHQCPGLKTTIRHGEDL